MKKVTIVCDGSSIGNGTGNARAAACAILGYKGHWKAVAVFLGKATNQQSEIAAAEIGLKSLSEPCEVRLLSDSRYVVETMLGNFKKKTNHSWWSDLEAAAAGHRIEWEWVKGHDGHSVQEVADDIARHTAEQRGIDQHFIDEAVLGLGTIEI
ncbi:MAG: RNase H family protein [Pyrinomonadaceae bacterium]